MSNTQLAQRVQRADVSAAQPQDEVGALIKRYGPQMSRALPSHITPDRFSRIVMTEIRRNPKLMNCDTISLVAALMQVSQLGLEPGVGSLVHLIPYGREVQLIVGYRGLIELARRSGQVVSIEAHEVRDSDDFRAEWGAEQTLVHRPNWRAERGEPYAYYALARFKDGSFQFEVMSRGEVEGHRKRFVRGGSKSPWDSDFDEMAKKTVIRRLCKRLPLTPEMADADRVDGATIRGMDAVTGEVMAALPAPEPEPEVMPADESAPVDDREPGAEG